MQAPDVDVLIQGAGPVGCALAMALRDSHLKVALIGRAETRPEFRPIALSYASRLILERLGVWQELNVTPIETIHVSQQRAFGRAILRADDARVPALGYVTEYASLLSILQSACADLFVAGELPARCVVHAEGTARDAREKRYAQDALVALIETEPRASGTAFERFTPEGPLALLPLTGRFAAIWSCLPARADRLAASSENEFLQELRAAAGRAAGVPVRVHARMRHPLAARVHRARVATARSTSATRHKPCIRSRGRG